MELRLILQTYEPDYISKNYIMWARPVEDNIYLYMYTDGKWRQIGITAEIVAKIADLYDKIAGITVPTKLSELTNDSGYITSSSLSSYYTKTEVDNKLSTLQSGITVSVVQSLPNTGTSGILYLVTSVSAISGNAYDEYLWVGGAWEKIGGVSADLSGYYTKTQVDGLLSTVNSSLSSVSTSLQNLISSYNTFTTSTYTAAIDNLKSSLSALTTRVDNLSSGGTGGSGGATTWETSISPYMTYDSTLPGISITGSLKVSGDIQAGNYKLSDLSKYVLISNINGYISDYIAAHPSTGGGGSVDLSNYYSKTDLQSYIEWLNRVMPVFDYSSTDSALKATVNMYSTGGISAYGNTSGGGGTSTGGIVQTVYTYSNLADTFSDTATNNTFNAYTIAKIASRLATVEQTGVTSGAVYTKAEINSLLTGYATLSGVYSKTDMDSKLSSYALASSLPTEAQISSWNTAVANSHTHANKTQLDAITDADITWIHTLIQYLSYDQTNNAVKSSINIYSAAGVTALG